MHVEGDVGCVWVGNGRSVFQLPFAPIFVSFPFWVIVPNSLSVVSAPPSCVYHAHDFSSGRRVALKVFSSDGKTSERDHLLFVNEAAILSTVPVSPFLPRYIGWGQHSSGSFLATEFFEGETLQDYVNRQGSLSEDEALYITKQIVRFLPPSSHLLS